MRRYPLYILDLDGTVYRGAEVLPGVAETLAELRRLGSSIRFLTNNSSQTPEFQATKLRSMGLEAEPDEVLTSGVGTAVYLASNNLDSAFVVGEPGLTEVLASHGIDVAADRSKAVVVGICRSFTYALLNEAMRRVLDGAMFVATNSDATYPMEGDRLVPGAGSIVAAVQVCSGVDPLVIGKPNPTLIEMTLDRAGVGARDALVVGDRFETDIISGQRAGCDTLLVLTGVTRQAPAGQATAESLLELLP